MRAVHLHIHPFLLSKRKWITSKHAFLHFADNTHTHTQNMTDNYKRCMHSMLYYYYFFLKYHWKKRCPNGGHVLWNYLYLANNNDRQGKILLLNVLCWCEWKRHRNNLSLRCVLLLCKTRTCHCWKKKKKEILWLIFERQSLSFNGCCYAHTHLVYHLVFSLTSSYWLRSKHRTKYAQSLWC